eukprot:scaffold16962_cov22-Tisochrysis_lutea.AAC.1
MDVFDRHTQSILHRSAHTAPMLPGVKVLRKAWPCSWYVHSMRAKCAYKHSQLLVVCNTPPMQHAHTV